MNVRLTSAISAVLLGCGCTTAQADRTYFCSLDGSRLGGVYFDRSDDVLVLDDVVITGSFDCKAEEAVCFLSEETSFEFARQGTGVIVIFNEKPWGGYEWRIDYASGMLFFRTKREGAEAVRTCDPLIS